MNSATGDRGLIGAMLSPPVSGFDWLLVRRRSKASGRQRLGMNISIFRWVVDNALQTAGRKLAQLPEPSAASNVVVLAKFRKHPRRRLEREFLSAQQHVRPILDEMQSLARQIDELDPTAPEAVLLLDRFVRLNFLYDEIIDQNTGKVQPSTARLPVGGTAPW